VGPPPIGHARGVKRPIDDVDRLAAAVTGRSESLFRDALARQWEALEQRIAGRTVLVTGAGGFIATQTLRVLLSLQPANLVLVDMDENRLAELIRTLRTEHLVPAGTRVEPRLVDITTPLFDRLLDAVPEVDTCLQFAAAKHVRTERDEVSLLRMLHVNINGTLRVTRAMQERNPSAGMFVVSTDKAADPSSFMGASKRLMEIGVLGIDPAATTTRFANVAFSTGSLLESWLIRLRLGQPLAVPADTWRYFVSPQEAGQLCAIAATAPAGGIVVPDEDATGLSELRQALSRVLAQAGLEPLLLSDEAELRDVAVSPDAYPVLVTARDTSGEKQAEKFVGAAERRSPWLPALGVVSASGDTAAAMEFAEWVDDVVGDPLRPVTMQEVAARMHAAVPEFGHVAGDKRLDDRV